MYICNFCLQGLYGGVWVVIPVMLLPNIFWFRISFRTLSSFFRVVIFSVCGFCRGDACLD